MSATAAPWCTAELTHTHGVSVCDRPTGHDGQHSALCESCAEDGYTDPSDRLEWDEQHENWRQWADPGRTAAPPPAR